MWYTNNANILKVVMNGNETITITMQNVMNGHFETTRGAVILGDIMVCIRGGVSGSPDGQSFICT